MPVIDPILDGLNDEQKRAVLHVKGPALILAGAGSGKTRALTHRIAFLMSQGVPAWQILAVTFTNKAATEMKERIAALLKLTNEQGASTEHLPVSGTFHSICVRILRRSIERIGRDRNFVIYDRDDQEKLMRDTLEDMRIAKEELKPRAALSVIGHFKSEAVGPEQAKTLSVANADLKIADVYAAYQKALRQANAVDFDDLLLETVRLFRECPDVLERYQNTWRFLHVDEYQDTNRAQYLLVSMLAGAGHNLYVIGDPDQSIYAFRGADIRNILDFRREYPDAVSITLDRNYRSTQQILDAANAVIAGNPNRPAKNMWTDRRDGAKVTLREATDERREAEEAIQGVLERKKGGMALHDQVILYRTNAQSRLFEEACLRAGIPYRIYGGLKFYARREVKDVLAYLHVIANPHDTISLLRIINVPSRKIGETTLGRIRNFCNERGLSLWQAFGHIEMVDGINESTKERLSNFATLISKLKATAMAVSVSELVATVVEKTGMEKYLRDDTEEGEERWQNVLELLSVTKKYDHLPPEQSLMNFLEEVALISDIDSLGENPGDSLTLMTLHLCKGLEFRSVTIVGCEEGLLPHKAAEFDRSQLEEERRLLYVGMTRAREMLTMMHAAERTLWGSSATTVRSRFLDDLPHEVLELKTDSIDSKYGWLLASSPRKAALPVRPAQARAKTYNEFNQDAEQEWLSDIESIAEGMRIEHRSLGTGTVNARSGDVIEVAFDNGKTKHLALGIAPIKILANSSAD